MRRLGWLLALMWATAPAAGAIEVPGPGQSINLDTIIASMTLEEKVGQLLMVGFGGTRVNAHSAHWVKDRRVGGVALFARNIENFERRRALPASCKP